MNMLDFLDIFNWIDRLEGLIQGMRYGDAGRTTRIEHSEASVAQDYEDALKKRGVAVYGRGVDSKELRFKVKNRQARWSEYILRRMGAPITSKEVDPRNRTWAARHTPGQLPAAWADRPQRKKRR